MRIWRVFRQRLRSLFRRAEVDAELARELAFHYEQLVRENLEAGMAEREARQAASRALGNAALLAEECRDHRRLGWLDDLTKDLAYAVRSMRGAPGFTAVASLSLALAIGANTAIFSLVDVLLLRDLRVKNPDELVEIGRVSQYGPGGNFSYPIYKRIRDQNTVLAGVLTMSSGTVEATIDQSARQPVGRIVSSNFFDLLGVFPTIGRLFSTEDDRIGAAGSTVTVISYGLWERAFGGDPGIIGKTLQIGNVAFTIVGVLPPTFRGLIVGRPDDFFIPIASEPQLRRRSWLSNRDFNWLTIVGRLRHGVSQKAAKTNLDVIFARFLEEFASTVTDVDGRRGILSHRLTLESARTGASAPRREYSRPVLVLMGAVGLVLVIACANVINLMLARGMARSREIGVRLAIGASRGRLVRQLLTESAALGLIGGTMGFALAAWGTRLVAALMADGDPTIAFEITPDGRVFAFTAVIALGAALVAGMVPAIRLSRMTVGPDIRSDTRIGTTTRAVSLWSRSSIAAQVALSLLLLAGASLLITSLRNLRTFDAGFDRGHVLLMALNPAKAGYTGDRVITYYRQILERVRNTPGIDGAGFSLITPISGGGVDLRLSVEGRPREPDAAVYVNQVSDGYFRAMGTRLLAGRDFVSEDRPESTSVAIINDALARRYFKNENPIGQRVRLGGQEGLEIVGVVVNAKYLSLREEDHPTIYVNALQQREQAWGLTLAVRTSGDPIPTSLLLPREVQAIGGTAPVGPVSTLAAHIDRSMVKERVMTRILSTFAVLALVLAGVGLYGVLGYAVSRRTNEIGIRLALGAPRGTVMWSVVSQSWTLVAVGVGVGVPAAIALTRVLSSLLYGVTPWDPWVLGGTVVCLFVVALVAATGPAWRAVRVDPLVALRDE